MSIINNLEKNKKNNGNCYNLNAIDKRYDKKILSLKKEYNFLKKKDIAIIKKNICNNFWNITKIFIY